MARQGATNPKIPYGRLTAPTFAQVFAEKHRGGILGTLKGKGRAHVRSFSYLYGEITKTHMCRAHVSNTYVRHMCQIHVSDTCFRYMFQIHVSRTRRGATCFAWAIDASGLISKQQDDSLYLLIKYRAAQAILEGFRFTLPSRLTGKAFPEQFWRIGG